MSVKKITNIENGKSEELKHHFFMKSTTDQCFYLMSDTKEKADEESRIVALKKGVIVESVYPAFRPYYEDPKKDEEFKKKWEEQEKEKKKKKQ